MPAPRPVSSLDALVGHTPAVPLARLEPRVVLKLETVSPEGTFFDRVARAVAALPLPEGPLSFGGGGEVAIGLARELARLRRPFTAVLTEDASIETGQTLVAWGAKVERTPFAEGPAGARARAAALGTELSARVDAALGTAWGRLAQELVSGFDSPPAAVVVGHDGPGVLAQLRAALAPVPVIAVAPEKSPSRLHGLSPAEGAEVRRVPDETAWAMRAELGKTEGLLVDLGSAAVVQVAVAEAKARDGVVWGVLRGTGERAFSMQEQF